MKQEKITRENPLITYCHLLAALMVFTGHWYLLLGMSSPTILGKGIQGCGVWILFLVSGFLSWNSMSRKIISGDNFFGKNGECWKFIYNKCRRIFPPLWLCLSLTTIFLFFVSENQSDYIASALKYLISNAILIPRHLLAGVFENNPYPVAVNGSLWTLPVEMACFISVPFLFGIFIKISAVCKENRVSEIISCAIVSAICIIMQIILGSGIVDRLPFGRFIISSALKVVIWFFVGILVYIISSQKIIRIIGGVLIIAFITVPFLRDFLLPYIAGCIFAEIVYVGNFSVADKLPKMKNICYGMFLYGFPIEQATIYLFKVKNETGINNVVLFCIALVLDILLAIGSYYLIEQKGVSRNRAVK